MPLKLTDTIMGYRTGFDYETILARLDGADAKDRSFATRLQFWCIVAGIDSAIPFAQWLLETDNARSPRWNNDLNASGMGIVADATAQPFYIPDVDAAARLFVQCLYSLVNRKRHPEINLWVSTQSKRGGEEWFSDVWLPKVKSKAMPDVRTVADLGLRYTENGDSRATWSWEDGKVPQDTYGKKLVSRIAEFYPGLPDQDLPVTTPSTPAEPVEEEPKPVTEPLDLIKDYLIEAPVTKQREGQGFNTGERNIVGLAEHETQGLMNGPDRQKFFSCPGGERCGNALVDFNIQPNGKIYRYQDPFTTNRIPYASGGDPAAITQVARKAAAQMGNPYGGVNAFYAAVEIEKEHGAAMTLAQIESTARLLAYICAMNDYPAEDWKYPDVLKNNVPTSVNHNDLYTSTNCRINDDDRAKFENRCTALLKLYYAGATPAEPAQPATPAEPSVPAPVEVLPGLDYAVAARLFGSAKGEDNATYKFDQNGPVSKLWLANGKATGEWPALVSVYSYESGARRYFVFDGGATIIAVKGADPRWLKDAA